LLNKATLDRESGSRTRKIWPFATGYGQIVTNSGNQKRIWILNYYSPQSTHVLSDLFDFDFQTSLIK